MYWDNSSLANIDENSGAFWYLISAFKYLFTGAHIMAYWYIPLVMVMALISPLYVGFIKLKLKHQLIIFSALLLISSFVQRPYERTFLFQAIQSLIYFTPFYLMGLICAIHKDKLYEVLKGKDIYLFVIVVLFIFLQTSMGDVGLYRSEFLTYSGVDILVYKMVFVCLFFMIWLHRFEHLRSNFINALANTSFAIYFLHVYILKLLLTVKIYFNLSFENYWVLAYFCIIILLVGLSMSVAIGINKLLPNHSFLLIGFGKKPIKKSKKIKLFKTNFFKIEP